MRRVIVLAATAALALAWSSVAAANPVMADLATAQQSPESMHVQVSYFCSDNWGEGNQGPVSVERDGEVLAASWVEGSVSFNGGSGIEGYNAFQLCDCDMEPGTYEYKLTFEAGQEVYASQTPEVVVTDPPPSPQEPEAMPEGDVMPWDIPDGPWPKGLDCIQWCLDNPVGPVVEPVTGDTWASSPDTTSVPESDVAAPQPDAGSGDTVKDDGGSSSCAAGPSSSPLLGFGLLVVMALLLFVLRNRFLRKNG